MMNIVGMFGNF